MRNFRLAFLIALFISNSFFSYAQEARLTLSQAIRESQIRSLGYKIAYQQNQISRWDFEYFRGLFLPKVTLNAMLPQYSRSVSRITLPTGNDTFVRQNQAYNMFNLGIDQNIPFTGGVLRLYSKLERIDQFTSGIDSKSFATVPVSLSYHQQMVGFNEFKWSKEIEPIRYELANRKFKIALEEIAIQTVELFFNVLYAELKLDLSRKNYHHNETLYAIAEERHRFGTVDKIEVMQLKLNQLQYKQQIYQDSVKYIQASNSLIRQIGLNEYTALRLDIPENVSFFSITEDEVMNLIRENGSAYIEYRLKKIEAEKNLAYVKASTGTKFSINANLGFSNSAPQLSYIMSGLANHNTVSIDMSVPLLNWGHNKSKRLAASSQLELLESQNEESMLTLQTDVAVKVGEWNSQQQQIEIKQQSKEISATNYDLLFERYQIGNLSLTELETAQNKKDNASIEYLNSLSRYWVLYYTLRKHTLNDF